MLPLLINGCTTTMHGVTTDDVDPPAPLVEDAGVAVLLLGGVAPKYRLDVMLPPIDAAMLPDLRWLYLGCGGGAVAAGATSLTINAGATDHAGSVENTAEVGGGATAAVGSD
jgi:hypothetical protein